MILQKSQKKEIIGLRTYSTGFEGLIELKKAVKVLQQGILY